MIPLSLYLRLGSYALALAGGAYGGYTIGHHQYTALKASTAARTAQAQVVVAQKSTQGATIAQQSSQALSGAVLGVRTITHTIHDKVPVYVHAPVSPAGGAAPDSSLPLGFVWLHNASARGVDPGIPSPASAATLDSPSGVDLPTLAGTVTGNYGLLHECQAEVTAWRGWYDAEAANWGKQDNGGK